MAKRGLGKFVAFAAISGAVAAGVSYVLQYKIYHKELDKDFREFEDEEDDEDDTVQEDTYDPRKLNRNYISLNSSKDEFKMAAKDMAAATKNVLKDDLESAETRERFWRKAFDKVTMELVVQGKLDEAEECVRRGISSFRS